MSEIMSSMPPPRGGLVKGDHVLISGVWFEMMNSAPQRRPSAAERSISDLSGNDGGLLRDGRASASNEEQSRSRDRGAHSHILVERDEVQILKPRPTQTRSITATSASCSSDNLQKSQDNIGSGGSMSLEDCSRNRNGGNSALGEDRRIQMSKPGRPTAASKWTSTSDFCDSKGVINEEAKPVEGAEFESKNRSRSDSRDGHALVNGVYHQMLKPEVSAPHRRNKLQKTRKHMKNGRNCSGGVGSKGPKLVIP